MTSYSAFLARKHASVATSSVPSVALAPHLFDHQRTIVEWALRRGRSAVFADTGLGKTAIQVEWARQCASAGARVLIVAPLAVAEQTIAEARRFGVDVAYVRGTNTEHQIQITNYDMLHAFDALNYQAVVLDESSILKAHDGATRTAIIEMFQCTKWRLACTATPAPNDYSELGNHAEFLGIRTRVEMLAEWFVHDGETTSEWRLKDHGEEPFWRWVCSWAVVARLPSDVGGDDAGYILPALAIHDEPIAVDHLALRADGELFAADVRTLSASRSVRRATADDRVRRVVELCAGDEPVVVWCELNSESGAIESALRAAGESVVQVAGNDDREVKRAALHGFATGNVRILVTKPKIAGHGLNWQHCAKVIFVGASYSYEQTYQAIRRCWRFGQARPVHVHILRAETERHVVDTYRRKERDAMRLSEKLTAMCKEYSGFVVARRELAHEVERQVAHGDGWELHLGDCVDVVRELQTESVGYTIFSPPFASLYTYSSSERDMGNCATAEEFSEHFRFLVPELLRVTMPGRLLSFHCMLLPTSKTRDGYIGLRDFRGDLIRMFCDAGWIHHSEVVIWKDPVTAMQRTKALGLLHKQIRKDSCMSRQGIPDYLVTMRKPGENQERVSHGDDLPVTMWQQYASPVWMNIDQSDTLQRESAREERDEKHICPLQLEVIRRALHLWSRPGDLVLSPFAGIGSEGFESLKGGRRFVGIELKRSYWEQARRNLLGATQQGDLFARVQPCA